MIPKALHISVRMTAPLVSSTGPFIGSVSIEGTSVHPVFGKAESHFWTYGMPPRANVKSQNASNAFLFHSTYHI